MAIIEITKENFEGEVIRADIPVLLDFWAAWCGPCRMLSPIIDGIADENDGIKVGKINVDEQPELAQRFNVMRSPTLVVVKNGKVTASSVGVKPKADVLALLK